MAAFAFPEPLVDWRWLEEQLQEALMWDDERTAKRTRQGVEGYDKPHEPE